MYLNHSSLEYTYLVVRMKLIMKTLLKLLFAVELAVAFVIYETVGALRTSRFLVVTQKSLVASYRRLGTTCRARL